jgi:macrolide transport system ATP-binding/permease protein
MKRPSVKRLFRFPTRSRQELADDAREEVQFHVEMRAEDLRHRGVPEADARAQALREFGDLKSSIEQGARHERRLERRRWVSRAVGDLRQDIILAVRLLVRSPGPSAAAVLTLAVAIAGNTATFSVANALLFKPVPVTAPEELARVRADHSHMSWPAYQDLGERTNVFADLVAHRRLRVGLSSPDGLPIRLEGEQTSLNYFDTIGVPPRVGRTYGEGEPRRDVVVLADHTWRARFGADPSITGRLLPLNGKLLEVIGVMPAGFRGVAPAGFLTDLWLPVEDGAANALLQDRRVSRFEVFGRLRPGITHSQAAAALKTAGRQIRDAHPDASDTFADVQVFGVDGIDAFRGMGKLVLPLLFFLGLMMAMAGVVLLIACANIAGVLIGRAAARRREIAVRLALGAGRGRLVRQLVTESLVLALVGGGLGVALALWLLGGVNAAVAQLPVPMAFDLQLDRRILLYALGLSTLAALVFGLAPARRAARQDVVSSLKNGVGGSVARQRLRRGLVIAQIGASSALLVWSGLFARSLGRINDVDPGFDPRGVLLARMAFDDLAHEPAQTAHALVDIQRRLEQAPGVASVGLATVVPLSLENEQFDVWLGGATAGSDGIRVMANRLTPGWFETVRIPLLAGRDFTWDDRPGAPDVAILNETFARRFANGSAVGQRLRVFDRDVQVVGVVRDSKYWTLGETSQPTIYLPFQQHYFRYVTFHVRTSNRTAATALLTADVRRVAPEVFVDVSPMTGVLSVAVFPARVGAAVTGAFGILAVLLAAVGVYGLVAFNVAQRTAEIGVRKVVGARAIDLVRLIVSENAALAAVGLGVGLGLGTTGAHLLRSFITDVSPLDPLTLTGTAVLVMGVTLAASASPAVRAVRVDALVVLRDA